MIKDAGKLYSPHGLDAAKSGYSNKQNLYSLQWQILISIFCIVFTAWKVSKYGVIYGVNLRLFGLNTEIYGMPIRDDEYAMITSNFWYLFFLCLIGGWRNFSGLLVGRVKCDVCRKLALSTSYHIKNLIFSRQWARQEIRFYVYLFCCSCFIFLFFVLVDCFSQNVCCFCYCFIIHGIGWHTMLSYQKQLIVNVCNVCRMIESPVSVCGYLANHIY